MSWKNIFNAVVAAIIAILLAYFAELSTFETVVVSYLAFISFTLWDLNR